MSHNKELKIKEYSFNDLKSQKKSNTEKRSLNQDNYLEKCDNFYHRNYPGNKYYKMNIKCENEIVEFLAKMQYERQKNESLNSNGDSD
jgi:hypothetical protein